MKLQVWRICPTTGRDVRAAVHVPAVAQTRLVPAIRLPPIAAQVQAVLQAYTLYKASLR